MLFVKKIEVVEVDRDRVENIIYNRESIRAYDPETHRVEETFKTEIVDGQRFFNARGQEICIGMTAAAREALGLPFSIFEDMRYAAEAADRRCQTTIRENKRLEHRLDTIKKMSWWERFNRLLIGY